MKYSNIYLFIVALLFSSCEKEISIDYKEIAPLAVLTCSLTPDGATADLSCTVDMASPDDTAPYTGDARITVTDADGNATEFEAVQQGIFTADIKGKPGMVYRLSVEIAGGVYTASSTMPMQFEARSTGFISEKQAMGSSVKYKYGVEIKTNRLADEREYFVCHLFRNGRYYNWSVVDSRNADADGYIDIYISCFSDDDDDDDNDRLEEGDKLFAIVSSVDKDVYTYYYSIKTASGNNSNPTELFTPQDKSQQSLLGFFSAQTFVRTATIEFDYANVVPGK